MLAGWASVPLWQGRHSHASDGPFFHAVPGGPNSGVRSRRTLDRTKPLSFARGLGRLLQLPAQFPQDAQVRRVERGRLRASYEVGAEGAGAPPRLVPAPPGDPPVVTAEQHLGDAAAADAASQ